MHFLFSFANFFTRKLSRVMDWYGCFGLAGLFSRFSFLALNCLLLSGALQADENNSSSGETPGNALFFDGNTYVNVPDNGTLDLVSNYTIEAWINVIDTQNNTIIDKGDYRFLFQTHTSGNQGISLYRVGVGWIHSQGVIPINEWVHVAVSVANDGTVKFYKNGQLLSSHQAGLGGVDNSEINIGRQSPDTCACNLANGSFDELRIWDSVRSQEEITAEYEAILASNTPGLLAYWKFNEENGVNVADSSLNANHGTVIGTATWLVSDAPAAGDSNDPPVDLHLTNALVTENDPVQTVVGHFEAIDSDDPEESGSYSYTFVEGNGSEHNELFNLEQNGTLRTALVFDYESFGGAFVGEGETWEFNNAGATGRLGPTQTQVTAAYGDTPLADSVTINTQGIQEWVVPETGTYRIEARGAQGGQGGNGLWDGGKGARMSGDFELTEGAVLKILVGQQGKQPIQSNNGAGGGGGTFVTEGTTPLLVAGGGGGAARDNTYGHLGGGDANVTNTGDQAGTDGGSYGNGKAAGFSHNGDNGANSFTNGGTGGQPYSESYVGEGGFGGGAGNSIHLGGGGGGFSGGNGGYLGDSSVPGSGAKSTGGGSYNAGLDQNNTAGANEGHGRVTITLLGGGSGNDDNKTLSIRVRVSDEHNASLEKSVEITLLDDEHEDSDGDGFTDHDETEWGSDPFDADSVPNEPPVDLHLTNASITENRPATTIVGQFEAIDPDDPEQIGQYVFSLVNGQGDEANEDFHLDANGTLLTNHSLDFEAEEIDGNATLSIRVRVADEHNASFEKTFSIILLDESQFISNFVAELNATYGDEPFDLNATSTSGLPVQYFSSNPSVAEVDANGTVNLKGAGQATITAFQNGGGITDAAPDLNATVTVGKAALDAIAHEASRAYLQENPELTFRYEGFVNDENASSLNEEPSIETTATVASPSGEYPITLSGGEAENYHFIHHGSILTIGKAFQEITFNQELDGMVFGQEPIELNATAPSGLPVIYHSSAPEIAEVNGTLLFIRDAGEVVLIATQDGNENFLAAEPVERNFEIMDVTPPVISLLGSSTVYHEAATDYEDAGAVAFDSLEGDVTHLIETNSTVNVDEPGDYEVVYNVTDNHHNVAITVIREVIVVDTTAPSLEVHGGEPLSVNYPASDALIETTESNATEQNVDSSSQTLEFSFPVPLFAHGLVLPPDLSLDAIERIELLGLDHEEAIVVWSHYDEEQTNPSTTDDLSFSETNATTDGFLDYNSSVSLEPMPDVHWEPVSLLTQHVHLYLKPGILISSEWQLGDFEILGTLENVVILEAGDTFEDPGFLAEDTVDGDLTDEVETHHDLNNLVPGDYHIVYQVEDKAGSVTQSGRLVRVVDHSAPLLTLRGHDHVEVAAGHPYEDEGASAFDVVDGNLSSLIVTGNSVNVELPGTYGVTFVVVDSRGNLAEIERAVVVRDWNPHELDITLAGDFVMENAPSGDLVGEFTAFKPGEELPHQFYLRDGNGSEDNDLFYLENGRLHVADSIDFEDKDELSIRVESVSSNGARFEKIFTIKVGDAQIPTVATGEVSEVGETSADVSGSLLEEGGNPILRIGFELSETPFGEDENETIVFVPADELIAHLDVLLPETEYHVRAVAENAEGIGYGDSSTFHTENASALYGAAEIEGRRNWVVSNWFGDVYRTETPWIYHSQLGWLYMASEDQYSIWLWSSDLGWVWTTAENYPYLYRYDDGAWLNFAFFTDAKRIFYNYLTEGWELYDAE